MLRAVIHKIFPLSTRQALGRFSLRLRYGWFAQYAMTPVRLFNLRRLMHFSSGGYLGTPITRYYWNQFLEDEKSCIQGHVLEIGNTNTVRQFGGSAITKADAIDIVPGPGVTITSDLSKAWDVPADQFDAFVNQFTMHGLRDDVSALFHSIRIMKPGGTLLCNFPGAGLYPHQGASMGGKERFFVYRWYTPAGVREMLADLSISPADYEEKIYGSLKGFLSSFYCLPAESLPKSWREEYDPYFPVLICYKIRKPENWEPKWQPHSNQ